ncbi:hypothetical protein [Dolichospermum phage Dfl-JY45]
MSIRNTFAGKASSILLGVVLGVGVAAAPVARATGGDAAAWIAWFTGFWPIMQQWLAEQVMQSIVVEKGDGAVVEQVAANTLGTQQALQQHAGVMVETIAQQTAAAEEAIYNRTFGTLMTMQVNGQTVTVGANAPSACRRTSDARRLQAQSRVRDRSFQESQRAIATNAAGYGSYAGSMANLRATLAKYNGTQDALKPDYLMRDTIPVEEAERVRDAISLALTPEPVPRAPSSGGSTAALTEYEAKAELYRASAALPAEIVARHAAMRVAQGEGERSYLATVKQWAIDGIESSERPIELAAKTEAGLLREMQLTMSAQLWVDTERLQIEQEQTLLLAMIANQGLNERSRQLQAEHARVIRQD